MNSVRVYLSSLKLVHWAILAMIATGVFAVVYYQMSSASCYAGTILGRACYQGYFTNIEDLGGTSVLPVISNGQALPSDSVNSASSLYSVLINAYNSGDAQKHTGAAFIYNTMMDNNAPGVGKNISNAQWNDLYLRLQSLDNAGKIDWGGNVSASINSYWQGTDSGFNPDGLTDDDAYYANFKDELGIQIRDYNNNVIYKILRRCANPIGAPSESLPPAQTYTLVPHITSISPTQIEAGSKVSVTSSVDNGGNTNSDPTQWEITQITVNPGAKAPYEDQVGGTTSPEAPCQGNGGAPTGNYFTSPDATCKNVAKGSGVFDIGIPSQNLQPSVSGLDIGDLTVGTRVCFALSVQPRATGDADWAHSQPVCTVVGKKPKIQIWGGDVSVRGNIETSTTVKDVGGTTYTFGSWVEYGAFSVGTNNRFASGSGTNNQTDNNQATWSKLTFANKNAAGADAFGNYTTTTNFPPAPGVAAYFSSAHNQQPVGSNSVDLSSLTFNTGDPVEVRTAGDLTITGGTIQAGKSVVIIATGTVTITGNITYTNAALNSIRDIPQVIIIAKDINIQDAVTNVDSWLIASDTINTCSNFTGNLTSNKCAQELDVNGPVITGRLLLNRTAGADAGNQSGAPAERFNLRPDAYLWAQLLASGNNKAQTVYSQELPPRF
jgi:hypothetical protein